MEENVCLFICSEDYHLPKTKRRQLRNTFQDYCEGSSLHGIKYLVANDRPWIERIWWFLATALSFVGSVYLISRVYVKWHNSPVIVSFAESTTSVWQIPFPAVTICSETKSRQSIFNYTWYHHKTNSSELSEEELIKREVIALTCDQHITNEGNEHLDPQALDYLEELGSPFEEVTWYCNWKEMMINCTELFTPIMTDEGICFTSNTLSHDDFFDGDGLNSKYLKDLPAATNWNLESGYKDYAKLETYPRRALGSGKTSSLTVVMRAYNKDLDYICRGAVQGFKVLLHNPAETPRVAERYFRAPLSQEVVLAVKPDMMTTSQTLRDYSPERRQCFFPHERKLAYFKVYTQRNCELECLTNFTLHECGCVSYFMPRSNSTPICGTQMKDCTGKVNEKMVYQEIKSSLDREKNSAAGSCNCLISCTSIQYEAETSQADYNWDKLFIAYKTNMSDPELQGVNLARVSIYYKDNQFITSHRNELYGYADFLAGCGGLLGLCSGFSLLSLVEIIYYATIRLFYNMRQDRKLNDTPKKKMLKLAE